MSKNFNRNDSHKKSSTPDSWRKPQGHHNRTRLEKKGAPAKPKAGYRTPVKERNIHPSGFEEVLIHNTQELEKINQEKQAARIASKVGQKKREKIIEKADESNIKILNRGEDQ